MAFLRRVLLSLSVGYVIYFFGERVFWSFARSAELQPENPDSLIGFVFGAILYSLFAYMMLVVIECFRVRTVWALFLAGSIFGWLVEGVYAMTFFGGAGIPLPFSIVWTAVAWHALISVLIGLYYLRISLSDKSFFHTVVTASALGLFWGVWALAWVFEEIPLLVTPVEFATHAFVATFFLIIAEWLMTISKPAEFISTRVERVVLCAVVLLFAGLVTFPVVPFLMPVLVVCFLIAFVPLILNRKKEQHEHMLSEFGRPVSFVKYSALLCMPAVATLIYVVCNSIGFVFPSNILVFILSSVLGTGVFVISVFKVLRHTA
ncbi:hypothetical protein K2X96_03135 [Patescibacteria group bacterium]|nr:hypothetical protein [Patescibacteria group bacterium]